MYKYGLASRTKARSLNAKTRDMHVKIDFRGKGQEKTHLSAFCSELFNYRGGQPETRVREFVCLSAWNLSSRKLRAPTVILRSISLTKSDIVLLAIVVAFLLRELLSTPWLSRVITDGLISHARCRWRCAESKIEINDVTRRAIILCITLSNTGCFVLILRHSRVSTPGASFSR